MKTPQEIAADIYWTATDATTGPAIRALIVAGIEASRKQNPGTPRSLPTTLGLDPLPWNNPYEGRRFADNDFGDIYVHLEPRPGYSQNPADYGVPS